MDIWSALEQAVLLAPHRVAVVDGTTRWTYEQVEKRARSLATFFLERDVGPGDRISVLADNSHEFFELYFAAAAIGAVLNPLNVRLRARDLAEVVEDAGSSWLVAGRRFADVASEIEMRVELEGVVLFGEPSPDPAPATHLDYETILRDTPAAGSLPGARPSDLAHLYYTSGTTGRSKGVMLTHRNVMAHAVGAVSELGLTSADTWAHIAPMFHLADAWATFAVTLVAGSHAMLSRFDPVQALKLIAEESVTITNLVPTMLNAMVGDDHARAPVFPALRMILSGGAPIAPALVRRILAFFGCEYVQTYGMTETSPYLTLSLLEDHLREAGEEEQLHYRSRTGRPCSFVELRVVGEDGVPVKPDGVEVGEIQARGETVFAGYWNDPDGTAEAFVDGWLRTGDLAVVDPEGYLNIVDRRKDMIISGGENVFSTEVESVLFEHPGIHEAAVFGLPDEHWGEIVCAAVVPRSHVALRAAEIRDFCRRHLPAFKIPRRVEFLSELPKTGSGKISKQMLREQFGPASIGDPGRPSL